MDIDQLPTVKAAKRATDKVIEEHRRSGELMVISPEPHLIQWVVPQPDGTMKVVREERVGDGKDRRGPAIGNVHSPPVSLEVHISFVVYQVLFHIVLRLIAYS